MELCSCSPLLMGVRLSEAAESQYGRIQGCQISLSVSVEGPLCHSFHSCVYYTRPRSSPCKGKLVSPDMTSQCYSTRLFQASLWRYFAISAISPQTFLTVHHRTPAVQPSGSEWASPASLPQSSEATKKDACCSCHWGLSL